MLPVLWRKLLIYNHIIWRQLLIYNHIICSCTITSAPGNEHGYNGLWYGCMTSFIRTEVVSHTLFSEFWSSPLHDMSVCPLLISAAAVSKISYWFQFVYLITMLIYLPSGNNVDILAAYTLNREYHGWAHKPGLTHLSLFCNPGPSVALCVLC